MANIMQGQLKNLYRVKKCDHAGDLDIVSGPFRGLGMTYYCRNCGMQADVDWRGNWIREFIPAILVNVRHLNFP